MPRKNFFSRTLITLFVIYGMIIVQTGFVYAQNDRQLIRENNRSKQKRIALVIGNGAYTSARSLDNPVNDANDMTATLRSLGFEVISGTDLTLREMKTKVREFGDRLRITKGVGLFYYAGHGVQVNNKNYLIPVNAEIPREDEVESEAFDLNNVMRKMATANNGFNIIILDACRNNPFARGWSRSADDGGLAQVTAPKGTFISYATSPNQTASDGVGENGLYTAELLKYLKQPGLTIEQAFKKVTIAVDQASNGKQLPWISSSLRGEFYFNIENEKPVVEPVKNDTTASGKQSPSNNNNSTGRSVWEPVKPFARKMLKYDYVFSFSEGLATVIVGDIKTGKWGGIDKTGNLVVPLKYNYIGKFSEGLATVRIGDWKTGKHGSIDKSGTVIVPIKYDAISQFSEGLAIVLIGDLGTRKLGVVDKTGNLVVPIKYDHITNFSEGLASVEESGKYGFINKSGKVVIPLKYGFSGEFSEGLAAVRVGDWKTGKYGFIDKTGKVVMLLKYDYVGKFSEGLADVLIGDISTGKSGFIDKTGNEVVPIKYDVVFSFSEGLAHVRVGDWKTGKSGFIDKTGKVVIPIKYDYVSDFSEGLAEVKVGDNESGKWGYINKSGNEVVPIKYDKIWSFAFEDKGIFGVELNGEKGFVDIYGNEYFNF